MAIHKPSWFSDDYVMVSTAPTCGLTKGGRTLRKIDPATGKRVQIKDADTGELVDAIDDQLMDDMKALTSANSKKRSVGSSLTDTLTFIGADTVSLNCAVPIFYDRRFSVAFHEAMAKPEFEGFSTSTLGELVSAGQLIIRGGHGSPSQEQRVGEVPYIKVSDLRAGLVNINPTNRVPLAIAKKFWRGESSGFRAFDLMCPERTSKNIGDFCVLLPGQEEVLATKEVIVLRPGSNATFDSFYLLWALTLKVVRDQWRRVIFMQTNREDVGQRFLEIEIPVPPSAKRAAKVSKAFRDYYTTLASARTQLQEYLASADPNHHFFIAGNEDALAEDEEIDDDEMEQ